MDFNDGNFQDLSGAESAEEDDRSDEIKQLLVNAFSDETFDDDSEHSFAVNSSEKQKQLMHGGNITTNINGSNGHGYGQENLHTSKNPFPSLRNSDIGVGPGVGFNGGVNGNINGGTLGSFYNGFTQQHDDGSQVNANMNINGGGGKKVRFESSLAQRDAQILNGRQSDRGLDEIEVINPTISLLHQNHCPQIQVGNGSRNGSGNGSNSGRSPPGDVYDGGGNEPHDKLEQMANLLEHRERQIQRLEEDAKTYSKDKRSLNHEIGLMKTEMIQMKNSQDELQKVIDLRDEEIIYLKTKMTEAIEEYEQVRNQELMSKQEAHRYMDEVEKLQQQVKLLSSIGSSARQTEVDDVVRQIREKHSKEIGQWQSLVADLERQLQVYKRSQLSLHNESVIVEKEHMGTQTDHVLKSEKGTETIAILTAPILPPKPITPVKEAISKVDFGQTVNFTPQPQSQKIVRFEEAPKKPVEILHPDVDGGGDASLLLQSKHATEKDSSVLDKYKEALSNCEDDKHRLIDFYEKELEDYKTKLAVLPSELYNVWTKQQEELGILYANTSANTSHITPEKNKTPSPKPVPVVPSFSAAATQTDKPVAISKVNSSCQTNVKIETLKTLASTQTQTDEKHVRASCVQTDTPVPVPVPVKSIPIMTTVPVPATPVTHHGPMSSSRSDQDRGIGTYPRLLNSNSNSNSSNSCTGGCTPRTIPERETSSVVIQTEETLETFNVLGELIQDWAKEVAVSGRRAQMAEQEVINLGKKYRELLNAFRESKQNWKERDVKLRAECEAQKKKFISVLSKVSSTLEIIE